MQRTTPLTRAERLSAELSTVAIELQSIAQRLANGSDVPAPLRAHAEGLAQAGRVAAVAAVVANHGRVSQPLTLFYGQYLETNAQLRDKRPALSESGFLPTTKQVHSAEALAFRRQAAIETAARELAVMPAAR